MTSSAFQFLDTLKDKNGQYILQPNITSPSGSVLFSNSFTVVDDDLLGAKAGDMVVFIGDSKAAVCSADRVNVSSQMRSRYSIHGQVLFSSYSLRCETGRSYRLSIQGNESIPVEPAPATEAHDRC